MSAVMETIRYDNVIDKSSWGEGPWQDEPDKLQWQDPTTGLPCLIVRGPTGALCGYVGVSPGHPLFGTGYDHVGDVEVHGGLTFAGPCSEGADESRGICHRAGPDEDSVWWFGFDCAHAWDLTPMRHPELVATGYYERFPKAVDEVYRGLDYVKAEVTNLATQLAGHSPLQIEV